MFVDEQLGSTRNPGLPKRTNLGHRIGKFIDRTVIDEFGHTVDVMEEVPLVRRPHFMDAAGRAPEALEQLAERSRAAEGYVGCTPAYNHAPSLVALNVLNHLGSWLFSFKPPAIVFYSAGQFGAVRARQYHCGLPSARANHFFANKLYFVGVKVHCCVRTTMLLFTVHWL